MLFKRQEYRQRIAKTLNFEATIYEDFERLCTEERTYPSHKIQELILEYLEKNALGGMIPIGIKYSDHGNKRLAIINPIETLDHWLDTGLFTKKAWDPLFKEIGDRDRMQKIENMTLTIHLSAKDRNSHLKTGRMPVREGQTIAVPSFRDV